MENESEFKSPGISTRDEGSNFVPHIVGNNFTINDLKEAFKAGSWVETWSDMGVDMKYNSFNEWFDKRFDSRLR